MSEEKGDLMSVEEGKGEEKIENENDESDSQVEFCAHDPVYRTFMSTRVG